MKWICHVKRQYRYGRANSTGSYCCYLPYKPSLYYAINGCDSGTKSSKSKHIGCKSRPCLQQTHHTSSPEVSTQQSGCQRVTLKKDANLLQCTVSCRLPGCCNLHINIELPSSQQTNTDVGVHLNVMLTWKIYPRGQNGLCANVKNWDN